MCTRRLGALYRYARRYRGYQVDPPTLTLEGPARAVRGEPALIRFTVSKLSAVEVKVFKDGRLAFTRVATFRRGAGSFAWTPDAAGVFRVELAAKGSGPVSAEGSHPRRDRDRRRASGAPGNVAGLLRFGNRVWLGRRGRH